jgi:protease-4
MKRWAATVVLCVLAWATSGCVYVSGAINPFGQRRRALEESTISGEGHDKLLLLDISRVITSMERPQAFGIRTQESTVARVEEALRLAREDERVQGVVLRIDSPGGGVTASDMVYRQIMEFKKETGRPVVAALMDLATSGAYYIALAADDIVASPTTVTGSIGVILMGLNLEGLMSKLGIQDQTVKSGRYKDLLSPFRPPSGEERAIVQGVIDELQRRFVDHVAQRRPTVAHGELPRITDGRIFTASQALRLGLVDQVGYLDDAIAAAKRAAGLEQARVVTYHRPDEYRDNLYSRYGGRLRDAGRPDGDVVSLSVGLPDDTTGARFMYLWAPGAVGVGQ